PLYLFTRYSPALFFNPDIKLVSLFYRPGINYTLYDRQGKAAVADNDQPGPGRELGPLYHFLCDDRPCPGQAALPVYLVTAEIHGPGFFCALTDNIGVIDIECFSFKPFQCN